MTRAILSFSLFLFYTHIKSTSPHASVFFCRKACWKQALRISSIHYIRPKLVASNKVTSFRKNDNLIMALFL